MAIETLIIVRAYSLNNIIENHVLFGKCRGHGMLIMTGRAVELFPDLCMMYALFIFLFFFMEIPFVTLLAVALLYLCRFFNRTFIVLGTVTVIMTLYTVKFLVGPFRIQFFINI